MAISILNDLLLFSCLAALHCLHFANLGVLGQVRSGPDENRLSHTVFQWRGVFTKLEYLILNHHTRLRLLTAVRQIGSNNKTSLVMAAIANAPYVSAVCVQTSAS
jgi:hypothetical protein